MSVRVSASLAGFGDKEFIFAVEDKFCRVSAVLSTDQMIDLMVAAYRVMVHTPAGDRLLSEMKRAEDETK